MGIRELREQLEVGREIRGGVLEGCQEEDPLFVLNGLGGGLDRVKVDMLDGRRVDLDGLVVIEYDGCLEVGMPLLLLIERHFCWRLGWAPAVEAVRSHNISLGLFAGRCTAGWKASHFCISEAEELTPRQSNNMAPVKAIIRRKRVLVSRTHSALVGGSCDLAAFQLIPPFGYNILRPSRLALYTTIAAMLQPGSVQP